MSRRFDRDVLTKPGGARLRPLRSASLIPMNTPRQTRISVPTFSAILPALLALALLGLPARAAMLSGSYTIQVSDSTNHIWDITPIMELQSPDLEFPDDEGTTVSWDAPFTQNGAGKLVGDGETVMDVFADIFDGTVTGLYKARGNVNSAKGIARLSLVSSAAGPAVIEERTRVLAASANVKLSIDSVQELITGFYTAKASASGYGSITDKGEIEFPWEDFTAAVGDGTWRLDLNLSNDGIKKMMGTAVVTLSTGQTLSFTVKGTYNATKDSTLLILVADESSKGSSLRVAVDTAGGAVLKGKLTGQQVKAVSTLEDD